jgi:kynureninase
MFIELVERKCGGEGFGLLSPTLGSARASQVSLAHPDGYAIMQALIERGVIGDFRAPNVLRFGLAPLYVRYVDVWDAVALLRAVMRDETWREPRFRQRRSVT